MPKPQRPLEPIGSVSCLWRNALAAEPFTTGVSLHSHTFHSREYLDFIPRILGRVPVADRLLRWVEQRHHSRPGESVRYQAAFWRPPLNPHAAYDLEAGQIRSLGLDPLVAFTDHDDLEACADICNLGIEVPYSLEWTVPFQGTVFHIGVFNLPALNYAQLMISHSAHHRGRVGAKPTGAGHGGWGLHLRVRRTWRGHKHGACRGTCSAG